MNERLSAKLKGLPDSPGVYMMKNAAGRIIYVGKAKNLKNRVRSYFHSREHDIKTQAMVSHIDDLDYIVVSTEREAFMLENNLIKRYEPLYNIELKDSRGYPYIRITKEKYPRAELARRYAKDGQYFGPYLSNSMANDLLNLLSEIYPMRTCRQNLDKPKQNARPCMRYMLKKCSAPCAGMISEEAYAQLARGAAQLLGGSPDAIISRLEQSMLRASEKQQYEKAAELRDRIGTLQKLDQQQKVVLPGGDHDVLAAALKDGYAVICALYVRSGRLIGTEIKEYPEVGAIGIEQLISQYIVSRYSKESPMCSVMIVEDAEGREALEEYLSAGARRKIKLLIPRRGDKKKLLDMAKANAQERMNKSFERQAAMRARRETGLNQLKEALGLGKMPERIECFDISHIQGTDTVASMVVLLNGAPAPKEYRRFKIRQDQNDDFLSMREVISRRYKRLAQECEGFNEAPDLIVIDGGKGQLSSACEILNELGLDLPAIGLAKRMEEVFMPGRSLPLELEPNSPGVLLLQTIRDEAHRFAITYHRSLRNKRGLLSQLEGILGIGPKRRKLLFKAYGSVERIKQASIEELSALEGMNALSAKEVYHFFHKEAVSSPESSE
ncbi:MAG: excinuclease ABC subunit C [Selenomonadales bacterium]|jgi:excinuclease ABC, C subunit|nr:excinuclease ABC subunit UvrC [Clostridiales bacterium]PWM00950.1 MAG: excinuclease ABC subunit C [Selenomonadales bacterium]